MAMSILQLQHGSVFGSGTFLAKETGVVFSVIRIAPSPKQRGQVIEILQSVQDLTRPIPGCLGCWLSEEDCLHNYILYAEQWEAESAMEDHVRSDLYRRVLAAMELSRQSPEIKFYYSSDNKGFELIEKLRGTPAQARHRMTDTK
jgi:quinol monooxygenase YgiN